MASYDFDGERYERASAHQRAWGGDLMSLLDLKGNERVLDLGCGDGALTERLARLVPAGSVLGIDSSEGMVATARAHHQADNLGFSLMDITDMSFENEFDVVFSNAALHWVHDHDALLAAAHGALRSGGCILWDFAGEGNCQTFFSVIREVMSAKPWSELFQDFTWPWFMPSRDTYETMAADAGFSRLEVTDLVRDQVFPTAEAMVAWIDQPCIVPFLAALPKSERTVFRDEVVRRTLERAGRPDGTCFESFRRIRVYATR